MLEHFPFCPILEISSVPSFPLMKLHSPSPSLSYTVQYISYFSGWTNFPLPFPQIHFLELHSHCPFWVNESRYVCIEPCPFFLATTCIHNFWVTFHQKKRFFKHASELLCLLVIHPRVVWKIQSIFLLILTVLNHHLKHVVQYSTVFSRRIMVEKWSFESVVIGPLFEVG